MKNAMPISRYTLFALVLSSFIFAEKPENPSIFDSLNFQEILKVEIETGIDSLLNTKKTEAEIPATFSYKDAAGKAQNWEVTLQVRGKFRRRICEFPPLRLTFPKKKMKAAGFNEHNDLKLVVHCVDNEAGDEYILREYVAYKLYQILSPESYRVQLLRVKYRDSDSKRSFTRYAILMEDEDELAERLGGELCEDCFSTPKEQFRPDNINTQDLFQYMIGNTDWSTDMCRNMKLIKKTDGKYVAVPYDFDFSGFVYTAYASVDTVAMKVKNVQQRVFLGFARSPEELKTSTALFQAKEKAMENYIKKFKWLTLESRNYMLQYLDSFFRCLQAGLDLKTPGKC